MGRRSRLANTTAEIKTAIAPVPPTSSVPPYRKKSKARISTQGFRKKINS